MDIDAIIAEANASSPAQEPSNQQDASKETENTEVELNSQQEHLEDTEVKKEEIFPKKAVNALSRKDKHIKKLKAEIQQLRSETQNIQSLQKSKSDEMPKEEDFANKTYGEYLDALTDWKIEQKLKEGKELQEKEKLKSKDEEWHQERMEVSNSNEEEARKHFSDFDKTVSEALSEIELEPHVRRAFLEADNPAFAFYAMAKDGTLEDLNDMSATKAAILIGKYEDKGLSLSKQKQQTKAPTPMTGNKGIGSGSKPLHLQSVEEIMAFFNNK